MYVVKMQRNAAKLERRFYNVEEALKYFHELERYGFKGIVQGIGKVGDIYGH